MILSTVENPESLYKRALDINEKAYGKLHPSLADILINMADLYEKSGRQEEARIAEERAKNILSDR